MMIHPMMIHPILATATVGTMLVDPIASALGKWALELNVGSICLRILMAVVIAAVIGCERASKRHSAGLRTFILVSLATTTLMLLDQYLGAELYLLSCAGVIGVAVISVHSLYISSKSQIKGLTTAVGLWACAITGLTSGAGLYTMTLLSFLILVACLSIFPPLERYLKNRSNHFEIHLELTSSKYLQNFVSTLRRLGLRIDDIEANPAYTASGLSVYSIALSIQSPELKKYKTHAEIIEALRSLEYISHMEEMSQ